MSDLNEKIYRALKEKGWLPPETEEEVRQAEKRLKEKSDEVPESVSDPVPLLEKLDQQEEATSRQEEETVVPFPWKERTKEASQELARAAREGKEIPPEVEEKMREDRKQAEEEQGGQGEDNGEKK